MGAVIEGLLLIGLSILGILEGLRLRKIVNDVVGPGWYVFFVSVILFIGAVVYLFVNLRHRKIIWPKGISLRLGLASQALGCLVLYAATVPFIGYAFGSVLFFIIIFKVFGVKTWGRNIVYGLVAALVFELVFSYIAGISIH